MVTEPQAQHMRGGPTSPTPSFHASAPGLVLDLLTQQTEVPHFLNWPF